MQRLDCAGLPQKRTPSAKKLGVAGLLPQLGGRTAGPSGDGEPSGQLKSDLGLTPEIDTTPHHAALNGLLGLGWVSGYGATRKLREDVASAADSASTAAHIDTYSRALPQRHRSHLAIVAFAVRPEVPRVREHDDEHAGDGSCHVRKPQQ